MLDISSPIHALQQELYFYHECKKFEKYIVVNYSYLSEAVFIVQGKLL